jgi:actin-related protein
MKINLAGKDLTEYLIRLMAEHPNNPREFSNIPETERDNARDTKEKRVLNILII